MATEINFDEHNAKYNKLENYFYEFKRQYSNDIDETKLNEEM